MGQKEIKSIAVYPQYCDTENNPKGGKIKQTNATEINQGLILISEKNHLKIKQNKKYGLNFCFGLPIFD